MTQDTIQNACTYNDMNLLPVRTLFNKISVHN